MPVEWDDLRDQLERLTDLLKPTKPGGVSTLGALVNTAADNLRGQGPNDPRHHHQTVAGGVDPRRPQQRHLRHVQEPLDAGVRAERQRRSARSSSTTTWPRSPRCWPTTRTRSVRRSRTSTRSSSTCKTSPPTTREAIGTASDTTGLDHPRTGRKPRRHQADAAHRPDGVAELQQHLRARATVR